jgi:hypothetical protein
MELEDGRYVLSFFSLTRACACETKNINRTPGGPKTLDPRPAPEAAAPVLYASAGDLKS